ncbi:hypothetical protein [Bacillus cereus]
MEGWQEINGKIYYFKPSYCKMIWRDKLYYSDTPGAFIKEGL